MIEKFKKNIFVVLIITALLYLSFIIFAEIDNVIIAIKKFDWIWFPLVLILAFCNLVSRFIKWHYYLNILKVKISFSNSFLIFMSGLIMSISPGKMGELIKSYLVKNVTNEPVAKTAPIIFAERITDIISLIFIAMLGAYLFNYGSTIVLITSAFFLIIILIFSHNKILLRVLSYLSKIKFFSRLSESLKDSILNMQILVTPVHLFNMTVFSFVIWGFELIAYYLVIINFSIDLTFIQSVFIYSFSMIAGSISMLPGGIGVTEGSLTFLLEKFEVKTELAVLSTLLIRIATLWFSVLIGIISLFIYKNKFKHYSFNSIK